MVYVHAKTAFRDDRTRPSRGSAAVGLGGGAGESILMVARRKEAPGKARNGEQHQGAEVVAAARTGRDR
jgi:hypothetical protein